MNPRHPLLVALAASAGLTARVAAQAPAAPPAAAPAGIAPHPSIPAGNTVWSKLGLSKDQLEYCKRKLCKTPLGQLLNNSTAPLQGLSGGLIPPFCPVTPSAAELADPGAVGAAAKVKADEAAAKERKAAVRFLGTVDCHFWPEAEDGLIGALRGDRNECVRHEAALALANGCCCTKKTIEALNIVVDCSNRDGAPKENSQRVKDAAQAALNHCLACNPQTPVQKQQTIIEGDKPVPEGTDKKKTEPEKKDGTSADAKPVVLGEAKLSGGQSGTGHSTRPVGFQYYARIAQQPYDDILAEARRVAARHPVAAMADTDPLRSGDQSLASLLNYAAGPDAPMVAAASPNAAGTTRPQNLWDMATKPPALMQSPAIVSAPKPAPKPTPETVTVRKDDASPWSKGFVDFLKKSDSAPAEPARPTAKPVEPIRPTAKTMEPARTAISPTRPVTKPVESSRSVSAASSAGSPYNPFSAAPAPQAVRTPVEPTGPTLAPAMVPSATEPTRTMLPAPIPVTIEPMPQPAVIPAVSRAPAKFTSTAHSARTILAGTGTPAERKQAVDSLEAIDLQSMPELVGLLVKGAKDGETPEERKTCIRALVRCQSRTPEVFAALEALSDDKVPPVRVEAIIGLGRLRLAGQ